MLKLNCRSLDPGPGKMVKGHGLLTARKLQSHQLVPKRHEKQYKKALLGLALQASPVGGVLIQRELCRKKWRLMSDIQTLLPGSAAPQEQPEGRSDGCSSFTEEDNEVLVAGFGRKGHSCPRRYFRNLHFQNLL